MSAEDDAQTQFLSNKEQGAGRIFGLRVNLVDGRSIGSTVVKLKIDPTTLKIMYKKKENWYFLSEVDSV